MNFRVSATVPSISAAGNEFGFVVCMSEFDHDCSEEDASDYIHDMVSRINPGLKNYNLLFEMVPTTLH